MSTQSRPLLICNLKSAGLVRRGSKLEHLAQTRVANGHPLAWRACLRTVMRLRDASRATIARHLRASVRAAHACAAHSAVRRKRSPAAGSRAWCTSSVCATDGACGGAPDRLELDAGADYSLQTRRSAADLDARLTFTDLAWSGVKSLSSRFQGRPPQISRLDLRRRKETDLQFRKSPPFQDRRHAKCGFERICFLAISCLEYRSRSSRTCPQISRLRLGEITIVKWYS